MPARKRIVFKKHARERMIERRITNDEVVKTIEQGVKINELERTRAIYKTEKEKFITVLYVEQRKCYVIQTAFESGKTDIDLYRRLKR